MCVSSKKYELHLLIPIFFLDCAISNDFSMKNRITSNIYCATYGHNYFRLSKANANTPELICKCCKNYFKFENDGSIASVSQREKVKLSSLLYRRRIA